MAKRKKHDNPNQLTLFDLVKHQRAEECVSHPDGSMDIRSQFRAAISEAVKKCDLSQPMIAARMTELLGREITSSMLYSWTAESHDNKNMPAMYLAAFCHVTETSYPIHVITRSAGMFVMESPDAIRTERDKITSQIKQLQSQKRKHDILLEQLEGK